ncbi:MAG: hypothetical protein JW819_06465 [Candidatus Krumholzibacteriota bacterium]|nr:hypothetical protein [Candidatus Krumholzibacteriota bacterium]
MSAEHAREPQEEARHGARTLYGEMRAIRHEQGLLVAELVWNEMRAWEIKTRLQHDGESLPPEEQEALRTDLARRLEYIATMADWERGADRSFQEAGRRLRELLDSAGAMQDELEGLDELLARPGLESIARAAAAELGIESGVSGQAAGA